MAKSLKFKARIAVIDENVSFDNGQLIVLGGELGVGKSIMAVHFAGCAHPHGLVLFNSMEKNLEFTHSMLSNVGSVQVDNRLVENRFEPGEEIIAPGVEDKLAPAPIKLVRIFDLGLLERTIAETHPVLVVVDPMDRFYPPANSKITQEEYRRFAAKELARMAREHKTIILVTAALSHNDTCWLPFELENGVEEFADRVLIFARTKDGKSVLHLTKNLGGACYFAQELVCSYETGVSEGPFVSAS